VNTLDLVERFFDWDADGDDSQPLAACLPDGDPVDVALRWMREVVGVKGGDIIVQDRGDVTCCVLVADPIAAFARTSSASLVLLDWHDRIGLQDALDLRQLCLSAAQRLGMA
jgi:hypothetical protein